MLSPISEIALFLVSETTLFFVVLTRFLVSEIVLLLVSAHLRFRGV